MTPAKRHDPQACPLSNLCLSGTGRTKPALPIIPPELSACPTWASPSGFQASSMLLPGQRAPREALHPGTSPHPRRVSGGLGHSGPLLQADLTAGLGGGVLLALFSSGLASPCYCGPLGLQAPCSRWPSLAGKQARWGGAGRRSGSSRWMLRNSLLGGLPSCCATLPHSRDRSLWHSEGWAPTLCSTDTWQPLTQPLPTAGTSH